MQGINYAKSKVLRSFLSQHLKCIRSCSTINFIQNKIKSVTDQALLGGGQKRIDEQHAKVLHN